MNHSVTMLIVSYILVTTSMIDAFQITNEPRGVVASTGLTPPFHKLDESTLTTLPSNTIGTNLPPVIQQIANERAEFQINLGRAMDTLRKDMPYILSQTPGACIHCCYNLSTNQ